MFEFYKVLTANLLTTVLRILAFVWVELFQGKKDDVADDERCGGHKKNFLKFGRK
jgi:hypothetical protein